MTNTILQRLVNFNIERGLDKQDFDLRIASMNILEELLEAHGVHDVKERVITSQLYLKLLGTVEETKMYYPTLYKPTTEADIIDAFMDITVYSFGEPLKMNYSPIQCLNQVTSEICSRTGTVVDGKFQKDTSEFAKSQWTKAVFYKGEDIFEEFGGNVEN